MTHVDVVRVVIARVRMDWAADAELNRVKARTATSRAAADHYREEASYWQGKVDGIRWTLETLDDAAKADAKREKSAALAFNEKRHDFQRRERVSQLAAEINNRELLALRMREERIPTEYEQECVWNTAVGEAVKQTESTYSCGRTA
jgi:hypothetical protein